MSKTGIVSVYSNSKDQAIYRKQLCENYSSNYSKDDGDKYYMYLKTYWTLKLINWGVTGEYWNRAMIWFLAKLIVKAKHHYYNTGQSMMTDMFYDKLEDNLRLLCPEHEVLNKVGTT